MPWENYGCRLTYGITQYYLPRDTSEHTLALTPVSKAGTQFTYPGGMEGWVDLGDLIVPGRASNLQSFWLQIRHRNHCVIKTPSVTVSSRLLDKSSNLHFFADVSQSLVYLPWL